MEQIGRHESFHAIARTDAGLIKRTNDELFDLYDAQELAETIGKYAEAYAGIYEAESDDAFMEMVMEEMLANAYAGMDVFGRNVTQYRQTTTAQVERTLYPQGRRSQENGTRETRGPDGGRYSAEDNKESAHKKITAGMSDSERTDILKNKSITVPVYTGQADEAIRRERENLESRKGSLAEKAIARIGDEFDVFHEYKNTDMDVKVSFSKGSLRESAHKIVTDRSELARLLPMLQDAIETAVGIESHDNRYFADDQTKFFHEMLGGYVEGDFFIPVRFGVKEFLDGTCTLYVVVSQDKIKTGVLASKHMEKSSGDPDARPVVLSVSRIAKAVNTPDLLRYLPDDFLSREQKKIKYKALAETVAYTNNKNDRAYVKALERNDLATAEKIVKLAAKAAGYRRLFFHGAKNGGGFAVFRDWSYFTENEAYAKRYAKRDAGDSMYTVYAKMDTPFDTRDARARDLFQNVIRPEYGTGEIQDTGLPDWTDGYDISDYIDENGLDYDSIILDEGGDLVNGEPVSRGFSYVIRKSNQVKSANPITYDDDGNVIPISQRFNTEENDIRYAVDDTEDTEKLDYGLVTNALIKQWSGEDTGRYAADDSTEETKESQTPEIDVAEIDREMARNRRMWDEAYLKEQLRQAKVRGLGEKGAKKRGQSLGIVEYTD